MSRRVLLLVLLFCTKLSSVSNAASVKSTNEFSLGVQTKNSKFFATLEPYLGYQGMGGITEKQINAQFTSSNGNYSGFLAGGRGLFEVNRIIFAGFDLSYAPSMNYSSIEGKKPVNNSTSALRIGPLVGVNIGTLVPSLPFRVWIGYNFLETLNDKNNAANTIASSDSQITLKGHSFKVGTGFQATRLLSINLEYIYSVFSTIQSDTLSPGNTKEYALPSTDYFGIERLSNQSFILSVSTPFNLSL